MAAIDLILEENILAVLVIWVLVYVLDYYLTIFGAKLYAQGAKEHILYEGSYELTPVFQRDIDALRLFSPRFFLYVVFSMVVILVFWVLDGWLLGGFGFFALLMGALFLREAAVYMRHFRVIVLYALARDGTGLSGRIRYRRWLLLRSSGAELITFSILFLVLYFLYGSLFTLGGALSCLVTGLQHVWWSRKARKDAFEGQPVIQENPHE